MHAHPAENERGSILCPRKSELPKHFAITSGLLHRFTYNFTHTMWHLFESPTFFFQSDFTDLRFQLTRLTSYYWCQIRDVDHLKERLTEEWRRFDQNIIDRAVNQWRDRLRKCIRAKGGHIEYLMWTVGLFRLTLAAFENSWRSAALWCPQRLW